MFAELAPPMIPVPVVVQLPGLFVLADISTGALLQATKGPSTSASAGGLTSIVVWLDTAGHGPEPSGSVVVQVNAIVLPD